MSDGIKKNDAVFQRFCREVMKKREVPFPLYHGTTKEQMEWTAEERNTYAVAADTLLKAVSSEDPRLDKSWSLYLDHYRKKDSMYTYDCIFTIDSYYNASRYATNFHGERINMAVDLYERVKDALPQEVSANSQVSDVLEMLWNKKKDGQYTPVVLRALCRQEDIESYENGKTLDWEMLYRRYLNSDIWIQQRGFRMSKCFSFSKFTIVENCNEEHDFCESRIAEIRRLYEQYLAENK